MYTWNFIQHCQGKSRIHQEEDSFTSKLELNLRNKLVQWYIWSTLYSHTYTLIHSCWRNKWFSVLKYSLLVVRRAIFYFPVGKRFSSTHKIPDQIRAHILSCLMHIICSFPLPESGRVVKISTYLHLELRSGGSIPPFSLPPFIAYTAITFPI
jgi:hypothetical protein